MATLIDHSTTPPTKTYGTVARLVALMETAQVIAYPFRLRGSTGRALAARIAVTAAIRRGGRTDAKQELVMDEQERAQWEADHPLPE